MNLSDNDAIILIMLFVLLLSVFYEIELHEKEQEIKRLKEMYEPVRYVDKEWQD